MENMTKKKLPLGVEDFKTMVEQCYYVDKTLLIKEMCDRVDGSVTLFTRPRRFGKSLALSMLDYYFSMDHRSEASLFKRLGIANASSSYQAEQGQYPLLHLNFKNIAGANFAEMMAKIRQSVSEESARHRELKDSPKLTPEERSLFAAFLSGDAPLSQLSSAARLLCDFLQKHYEKKVVVLIDEYDAPIERAKTCGYLEESLNFFRSFYGEALNGNSSLRFAALSGVLQISKESLFSGLNNLVVDGVLGGTYSEYFGFSESEVRAMLTYFGYPEKMSEVSAWYDGYRFGNAKLYNPWSVINYIFFGACVGPYWTDTGENTLLAQLLFPQDLAHTASLGTLLGQGQVKVDVSSPVTFKDLDKSDAAFFSFLLSTGYLTWSDKDDVTGERTLVFPNLETAQLFQTEVIKRYAAFSGEDWPKQLRAAFLKRDEKQISDLLSQYLVSGFSAFDFGLEKNYQCLLLGMASVLWSEANVSSETQAGEGRCDILIAPKKKDGVGVIIEVKNNRSKQSTQNLQKLAQNALKQIIDRQYQAALLKAGITTIYGYGIAFYKQSVQTAAAKLS
jgi:Protein of unknown function (DUF1703)./Predicted AAA-ATPase.